LHGRKVSVLGGAFVLVSPSPNNGDLFPLCYRDRRPGGVTPSQYWAKDHRLRKRWAVEHLI